MNKKKLIIYSLVVFLLVAAGGLYYTFRASPDSLKGVKADYALSAEDLVNAFEEDESAANTLYLDKVIEVSGKVIERSEEQEGKVIVYLEGNLSGNISCLFELSTVDPESIILDESLTVKGKCTGYILDVVLTKCSIKK